MRKKTNRSLWSAALFVAAVGASAVAGSVPDAVVGRWIATTSSAINYWNGNNGQFLGNGSGSGQVYDFKPDGTYSYVMVMEVRTGNLVSKVNNSCQGTVKFAAHKFTLSPSKGRYHVESGGHVTDREMTAEDLGRLAKTYTWKMAEGADGKPVFLVPFEDGSKFEFKPTGPA